MDAREAREHLEMVDEILKRGDRSDWSCRELGITLIGFGCGAAVLNLAYQLGSQTSPDERLVLAGIVLLVASLIYMGVWMTMGIRNAERISLAAVRNGRVMGAVWGSVFVASICQPHIFDQWSASAIWSLGGAISLLVSGFFGDRRALAGGLILLASMLVANFVPSITGYALAGGFLAGYVLIGVLYAFGAAAPDRG